MELKDGIVSDIMWCKVPCVCARARVCVCVCVRARVCEECVTDDGPGEPSRWASRAHKPGPPFILLLAVWRERETVYRNEWPTHLWNLCDSWQKRSRDTFVVILRIYVRQLYYNYVPYIPRDIRQYSRPTYLMLWHWWNPYPVAVLPDSGPFDSDFPSNWSDQGPLTWMTCYGTDYRGNQLLIQSHFHYHTLQTQEQQLANRSARTDN